MTDLKNQPDPSRLIHGLRDTGYNFNTAAADIIDNSIAAGATEIKVQIDLQPDGRKFVIFGDNGCGMNAAQLFTAMRYGAPVRDNLSSLGKFGLGLKTASTSICLKLTVISTDKSDSPLNKLAWDLNHVENLNEWEMLQEDVSEQERQQFSDLCGSIGTMVIWSKCDRLLAKNYSEPGGTLERRAITSLITRLDEHLSLVFYRFLLSDDTRQDPIKIIINNKPVSGWNPFYPQKSEQVLNETQQTFEVIGSDHSRSEVRIKAWILPHSGDLTKAENEIARITNKNQGFYIHRQGRLIQQGGWMNVFGAMEPHQSLLRIEFDFDNRSDEAFKVDVKKSQILFDPAIEDYLKQLLSPVYREAGQRYRRRTQKAAVSAGVDHRSANISISETTNTKTATVLEVNSDTQSATISNNFGAVIKLKVPIQNNVSADAIYVEAVDDIRSGRLWEPSFRSTSNSGHVTGVRINKYHDFYQKIYLKASSSGYAVEGMDLLLWAMSAAEQNNTDDEVSAIFEDIRQEISSNLEKLLRRTPAPTQDEIEQMDPSDN